ncbi:unnamed protein product [Blumeria hordei]|uniref:Uncharacterized protein n=1 Tax=Blumeria hordei TaxID=2867405 RepID=A0A383UXF0_BLUHO|nr:unnamed protein product [Blumeria hordei]
MKPHGRLLIRLEAPDTPRFLSLHYKYSLTTCHQKALLDALIHCADFATSIMVKRGSFTRGGTTSLRLSVQPYYFKLFCIYLRSLNNWTYRERRVADTYPTINHALSFTSVLVGMRSTNSMTEGSLFTW